MAEKDWRGEIVREVSRNPLLQVAALGIGVALLGLSYAAANSTPEKRSRFKERMRRQREDLEKAKVRNALQIRLPREYFAQGEGKALYEAQAFVFIPRGRPYPDARFEITDGGRGFEASSKSAGLRLSLEHDFRDAVTSVHMERAGGPHRHGVGGVSDNTLGVIPQWPMDFDGWVEDARLMAGLIAAPGSTCARIKLHRPDKNEIRQRLWIEHLRRHPDIAAATGEAWRLRV